MYAFIDFDDEYVLVGPCRDEIEGRLILGTVSFVNASYANPAGIYATPEECAKDNKMELDNIDVRSVEEMLYRR